MLNKLGFALVLDFGGILNGFLWFFGACLVICIIGSIIKHFYEKLTEPESEEHKKERLAQIEAQKKAQEAYKEAHKNDWILAVILLAMMAVPFFLLLLFNH